jgi:hypothetical protein
MIQIYDDILNQSEKDHIENFLRDNKFAWHLGTDENHYTVAASNTVADGNENTKEKTLLCHIFYLAGQRNSLNYELSDFIFSKFLFHTNHPFKELIRSKANLQLRSSASDRNYHSTPHVDYEYDHYVLLYYANDTDGNTVIFDRQYGEPKTTYNIIKEVEPRKGRFLFFNGKYYHAARSPTNNELRLNVNFNFI